MIPKSLFALLALVCPLGCSASFLGLPTSEVVDYTPQALRFSAPRPVVFQAAREFVVEQELRIVYEDANLGRIEAVSDVETGGGMTTRQRWVFQIERSNLMLDSQLEQRDLGGNWRAPHRVSSRYTYTREKIALRNIEDRLIAGEVRAMNE